MSELESKVAEQLTKLNAEDSDYDPTLDEPGEVDKTTLDDNPTESNDAGVSDDDSSNIVPTDDAMPDPDADVDNSAGDTGDDNDDVVPDAYLRAAVHQGWKEEEVKELWKTDPELAEKMLKANLTATNNLSNQWSQLGQQQMNTQVPPAAPATPVNLPTTSVAKTDGEFKGLDLAKLKSQYDDDNLIDDVIKPMNDMLIKMHSKLDSVETAQVQASQNNLDTKSAANKEKSNVVAQQIDSFFDSLQSKDLKTFYGVGPDWSKFEGDQASNRMKLLEQADQIKTGAAYQGKEITNESAMNLANLILSSHLAEQKIIGDIKKSLTKREKSLSLKPSGSRASSANDAKADKSEKGLIKTIGAFMKERKIKQY
jgi:hypothetical protein